MDAPKTGDVVRLVSGGPYLAVERVTEAAGVCLVGVVWLDEGYRLQRGEVRLECLKAAPEGGRG